MQDAFIAGGWGMYPTLLAGLALIATCIQYARRPQSRYMPLMLSLGVFTLMAGTLGFVTGLVSMLRYYTSLAVEERPTILLMGFYESLHNVVLALLLATVGTLLASVGAWRLSRGAVGLSTRGVTG
jgi:hypothetical protein